ncbi:DUF4384 domain-containing protein [Noviherbaspirillum sedimenti]|uniref:DUF4384 domain-containing protein n=1 Tax=Noviherbaspirillum sedimenti TaxID=2320865 RepID=A0A3A3FYP7_9BURK|nr:DUF4384 domain-containing protein [Noviherbaspirillum sedimenti]RJG00475.1 DUF4384 domain-containing protein [Noviherbaspirillum sedimenti]
MKLTSLKRHIAPFGLAALGALAAAPLHAENYALILTIGNYSNPNASLPGIDLDARMARKIAQSMGVQEPNILDHKDSQLSQHGLQATLATLTTRIAQGDNVFIYYSGHGSQRSSRGAGKCSEGMVTHDMSTFDDIELETTLKQLAAKAGQVVMLNDSCFSGGQATKSRDIHADPDRKAKTWKDVTNTANYQCGNAINAKMTRNLVPTAAKAGANFLYIAAAADNEVAFATSRGSSATVAWSSCLDARADADRSGMLTGRELQRCAQEWIRNNNYNQTITLVGNADLPLAFAHSAMPAQGGTAGAAAASADGAANALAALENLRQQASPNMRVQLRSAKPSMKIGRDYLDLSVTTNQSGYLYLLHVGSDGKSFDLLFPNSRDANNHVQAGTTLLPRPSWGIQAAGPAGTSYVMAILSETPREFGAGMTEIASTPFRSTAASTRAVRNLAVVGMGQGASAPGRIGASAVLPIIEVN